MNNHFLLIGLFLTFFLLALTSPAKADYTVFTVNDTADLPDLTPGDGVCGSRKGTCTLRAAVQESNAYCGGDYGCEETIILPAGTFKLTRVGTDDNAFRGDLDITGFVTIRGAGAADTVIDGNGAVLNDRIFHLIGHPLVTYFVRLEGVTLVNGQSDRGGAIYNQGMALTLDASQILYSVSTYWGGGAIYNDDGRLDVIGSNLAYNEAKGSFGFGGAIYNSNTDLWVSGSWLLENKGSGNFSNGGAIYSISGGVAIDHSTVEANDSAEYGGGLYVSNGWLHVYKSDIKDNYAATAGGGILVGTAATLKLSESTVTGNMADINVGEGGGGLFLRGDSAEITDSQIHNNSATKGGGLYDMQPATIITRSTISDNYATPDGGGIYHLYGDLTLVQSTVHSNRGMRGAGIFNDDYGYGDSRLHLVNSTLSGNEANIDGGGIYNDTGDVALYNVTIAMNEADGDGDGRGAGAGIFNQLGGVQLQNSLLADNVRPGSGTPDDCFGSLYSGGYNLIESITGCTVSGDPTGNIIGQDAQLGPLDDNGGPTWTHAIPLGSPAVETANPNGCQDGQGQLLEEDQRGWGRHLEGDGDGQERCDIGAYENGEGMWP
jgi:hypothetical protein